MNDDFFFLKSFYMLLDAGYNVKEALEICENTTKNTHIKKICSLLENGISIENAIIECQFPHSFIEYFTFFKTKKTLSLAIKKSIDICLRQKEYKKNLQNKLSYPFALLLFLFGFSLFVIFEIIPNINKLFISFQIEKSFFVQFVFCLITFFPILFMLITVLISIMTLHLLIALRKKSFRTIEFYLKIPIISNFLKKYFSLKFSIYYNELLKEEVDQISIIHLLNNQLANNDLKIVLYEIENNLLEGEALEDILNNFEYLDDLFIMFFQMLMKNPKHHNALEQYIQITYEQINICIHHIVRYIIPMIYGFVAIFVITVYLAVILPMMNIVTNM